MTKTSSKSSSETTMSSIKESRILTKWENDILFINVPGGGGSGPDHWQTYWENQYSNFLRVQQIDWDKPNKSNWINNLIITIKNTDSKKIILIGHSLGCCVILHALKKLQSNNVAGIFLVGLPDIESLSHIEECQEFRPLPKFKTEIPISIITSSNDPYCSIKSSTQLGKIYNANTINIGEFDHIGSDAKLKKWDAGQVLLNSFVGKTQQ